MFEENITIVAAHPDDEVLGMGGTINKLCNAGKKVSVLFLSDGVSSRSGYRESSDSRKLSAQLALELLGCKEIHFTDFPDNQLDTIPMLEVCKVIEKFLKSSSPDTVFTHFPFDLNVDHRIVSEATRVASRPSTSSTVKNLLFFEVLSSTGWNFSSRPFSPNLFIEIENEFESKILAMQKYEKEVNSYPNARSFKAMEALAVYRGATVGKLRSEAFEVGFIRT